MGFGCMQVEISQKKLYTGDGGGAQDNVWSHPDPDYLWVKRSPAEGRGGRPPDVTSGSFVRSGSD